MNICELIDACGGPEKVKIQFIDQCAERLDYNHRKGSKITFCTEQMITLDGTKDHGIIVWLPRDKVDAALAQKEPVK